MRTNRPHRVALGLVLAALLAAALPALADAAIWSVKLAGVKGDTVAVVVSNGGSSTMSGVLTVQAVAGGVVKSVSVPVSVAAGSSSCVSASFGATVSSVGPLSMSTDGPTPF